VEPSSARKVEDLPGYDPVPNPLDELAMEVALGLRDREPCGVNIRACSVGGKPAQRILKEFLACGADQVFWLQEEDWEPDGSVVAQRLVDHVRSVGADLCLFGTRDVDTGSSQVGPMFSVLSGLPYVDSVVDARWEGTRRVEVTRVKNRIREKVRIDLPACLGILRGNGLRYPSLQGKMRAAEARIEPCRRTGSRPTPCVERLRFTRAKPKKGMGLAAHAEERAVDKMRRAFGFAAGGGKGKGPDLIRGNPLEAARRILEIWEREKIVDPST